MSMSLTPRILPGNLNAANKGACDWGWQRLYAYGCQNYVVVIDPNTIQVIQTVHHKTSPICLIKWAQENYYHDVHTPYQLKLAAGDTSGSILIWDIREAVLVNELVEANRTPLSMEWLKRHEVSKDLLLVLYAPNVLCLWNADTGVRLWKKVFQDNINSVAVDPFYGANMTVMSNDWIMLVKDLSLAHPPSEKGRKFYMSTSAASPSPSTTSLNSNNNVNLKVNSKSTFQKLKLFAVDLRGRGNDEQESSCECLQVTYLPSNRNHVLLLFPREIMILDMEIGQALGSFSIEQSSPSFHSVIPCSQRDVLFLLHDNGSISMRALRSPPAVPYEEDDDPDHILSSRIFLDIIYDIKCHSDVFRLSRASRLMGFCVDPVNESHSALLLADGRILFWSLSPPAGFENFSEIENKVEGLPNLQKCVETVIVTSDDSIDKVVPPLLTFGDNKLKDCFYKPRFLLDGIFEGVALNPVCARMCPPMTTKNFSFYKPLLAIGCSNGVLQLFNVSTGQLVKHYSMPSPNMKGIEWVTLTTLFIYFQGSTANDSSEIIHLDVNSGLFQVLPSSRGLKESTIAILKVSHLRQYFLVLFKNHAVELWDAVNLCQIREFPTNFPRITAFEWSPSSYGSRLGKKKTKNLPTSDSSSLINLEESTTDVLENKHGLTDPTKTNSKTKEHLVFTDSDGTVYHYVVEGPSLRDGSKVPPEAGMSTISYIAWKTDILVLGDIDGNLNLWDLKAKVSRVFNTNRGAIKRIKFAPGKGNMKVIVLFNDGIEIWDVQEAKVLGTIKTSKDQINIFDADWLSSALPLLLVSDGSVRVLEATLKSANSPIEDKDVEENVFNPRLLDHVSSLKLKQILQHQRWRETYDAKQYSDDREERHVQDMLENIPREMGELLYSCRYGTAERCIHIAQIYGDESDFVFWNVALHYLRKQRLNKDCLKHQGSYDMQPPPATFSMNLSPTSSLDDFLIDSDDLADNDDVIINEKVHPCTCLQASLDTNYDILCDNRYYKKMQLYRIALHDSHRSTYEHTRLCAEKLILAGQMDRAVQVLLEGEPTDDSYYSDALRACLISTVKSTGNSQSTIKLVATNLIASGKLNEGVELLCLVDKGTDACRYLQTYGNWELATWLSKVRLSHSESCDVIMRWCEQLSSSHVNKKVDAILVLLSFGKVHKVLEVMFSLGHVERAVLFLEACVEFDLISLSDDVNSTLYENIFLDYARLQIKLKNKLSVEYYANKAGGRGKKLLEELPT